MVDLSGLGAAPAGLAQLGFGIYDMIRGGRDAKRARRASEDAINARPMYTESPFSKSELAQAQAQANSVNPAIASLMNQQQQAAANTASAAQNYAQSGGEAIQAAIAGQQLVNQNLPQIAAAQNQYNMQNRNYLIDAMRQMTGERQNVFNDRLDQNALIRDYRLGQLKAANKQRFDGRTGAIGGLNAVGNSLASIFPGGI